MRIPNFTGVYEELVTDKLPWVSTWGQYALGSRRVSLWIPCLHQLRALGVGVIGGTESGASEELAWNSWQRKATRWPIRWGRQLFCGYNGASWADCLGCHVLGGRGQLHLLLSLSAGSSFTAHSQPIFCFGGLGVQRVQKDGFISGVNGVQNPITLSVQK